jgi:predicted glycoside hydrolase/deacetylase ChbG (UPF0249 family)
MVKRVIINADDFGLCESNTLGIISAHKNGILTSATCMMNMPYAKLALEEASKYPDFGVGIHLTLTVGSPLIKGHKSFTDENGNFKKKKMYPGGQPLVDEEELYAEWKAQIEKFIEIAGKKPTHIDSHHHVHMLSGLNPIAKRLALEYDIPMRQRDQVLDTYEYVFVDERFYEEGVTYETLKSMLLDDRDIVEVMNHVGFLDQQLYDMSSYNLPRMKELEIIKSDEMKQFVKEHNIELINFSHVKKM